MSTYAIIGASRGIGLEFVRQLAARPQATVFVTIRSLKTANHLLAAVKDLKNVHIIEADVTDYNALERAAKRVSEITGGSLDVLIHNAARITSDTMQYSFDEYPSMDALDEDFIDTFKINTLGVIHSIKAFLPLLQASKAPLKKVLIVNTATIDSKFILKADFASGAAYATTKSGALVVAAKWAVLLKKDNIVVTSVHPGLVNTWETRGENGSKETDEWMTQIAKTLEEQKGIPTPLLTPADSAKAQIKIVDELTMEKTGLFLNFTGEEYVTQLRENQCWSPSH